MQFEWTSVWFDVVFHVGGHRGQIDHVHETVKRTQKCHKAEKNKIETWTKSGALALRKLLPEGSDHGTDCVTSS